ncbi:hypothetical protein GGR91_002269 [Sphingorhabdus rigui]|uniref:Glycosyltransferase RgtA/B/C/D-like domain-containing protein n=1 Tax=Sphingorhabdus rigui TaxID=1282858 RepID=A0A840B531_9SPHN|nr:hypothetical protein [Sphingorhabdus rigui]MBB3944000.1 hypothetical protein [Sphingorhabdus rigui]
MHKPYQNFDGLHDRHPTEATINRTFSKLFIVHGLFTAITLWVALQQAANFEQALARGMFIPDVVNMTKTFDNLWRLYGISPYDPTFPGVSFIYGWTWLFDPSLSWFVNNLLMLLSGFIFLKYLSPRMEISSWSVFFVYLNPYVVLASVGPNKEIPLTLISLIWISILISPHKLKWPLAFLLSFFAYFVRDGFGFILLMTTVFCLIWGNASRRVPISMLAFGAFVSTTFGILVDYSDTLARNLAVTESGFDQGTAIGSLAAGLSLNPSSTVGGFVLYFIRIIYNALVLGIFPNFITNYGYWNILGFSYWISGIFIIISIFSSSILFVWNKIDLRYGGPIFLFFLTCLFSVSVSQFVQPRYLMPAIPLGLCATLCLPARMRRRLFAATLVLIISVIMLYGLAGRTQGAEAIEQIEKPAFVWFD